MRKFVFGFHGFNVGDQGMKTIDKMKPYVESYDYEWIDGDYGWKALIGVQVVNEPIASCVAETINHMVPDDTYIVLAGHSNGGAIVAHIANNCPKIKQLLLINPALEDDWKFPETLEHVHVFGTPGDFWTAVSRIVPGSEWGDLSNGYEGEQHDLVTYHNMGAHPEYPVYDHSEVFDDVHSEYWLKKMMAEVERTYQKHSGN